MDNIRLLLFMALCFVSLLLWRAWQEDYAPVPPTAPASTAPATTAPAASPSAGVPVPPAPLAASGAPVPTEAAPAAATLAPVVVTTDLLRATIDAAGGSVRRLELLGYPEAVDRQDEPFVLLDESPDVAFQARGGLLSDAAAPGADAVFEADASAYTLAEGEDRVEVALRWESSGVRVAKIYTFHRGSYVVDLRYEVSNQTAAPWNGRLYGELLRKAGPGASMFGVHTYTGAAISGPEKTYEKISFDDMKSEPLGREVTDGWAAMLQHYFVSVLIPERSQPHYYYSKALGDGRFVIGLSGPLTAVAPGGEGTLALRLYFGPKLQHVLAEVAPHLDLTVDYGALWFIAKPLYWLLEKMHALSGNWGLAIILLTLLVKGAFFQLSAASYRSMAKMRKVQPRLVALRERYAEDRARLNQAMMELYKEEKINPLGGCLPIVVQIPVFLSLYWVLLESVELRQAPFFFWIQDLSTKDPYYVLPLLMGVSMFAQMRLNPAPPDPIQAKIMQVLPFVFTFFFLMFPSGLVLYWFVNNLLSIAQQWIITRQIEGAARKAA